MTVFGFRSGEVALVTGGASGIGLALTRLLLAEGVQVACFCLPGTDLPDISAKGWLPIECDVRDETSVVEGIGRILEVSGRLDMMVNNAALVGRAVEAPLLDHPTALFREVIDTNLTAPFVVLRETARAMVKLKASGRIVNVASIRGLLGGEQVAGYSSAKAGLVGLTRSAALELAPHGIRVNAVAPGFIATELALLEREHAQPWQFEKGIPLGRPGAPEEAARVIAALLSADSGFVTGAVYVVDGGMSAY